MKQNDFSKGVNHTLNHTLALVNRSEHVVNHTVDRALANHTTTGALDNFTRTALNYSRSAVNSLVNRTEALFPEPTRMPSEAPVNASSQWHLILGFAVLFAVSIGCVYFVIRCIRGSGSSDGGDDTELGGDGASTAHVEVRRETSRLIPTGQDNNTAGGGAESSGSGGVSAARARFLEQRKQAAQQKTYGATS